MGQNGAVTTPPKLETGSKDSGLGWPSSVSRETSHQDSVATTGLGWPE